MAAILEKKPVSPLSLNPALPPEFESILGKALEKPIRLRYQSAAELRADLQHLKRESDVAVTVTPGAVWPKRTRVFRQAATGIRYLQWGLAGLLVTVALVVGLFLIKRVRSGAVVAANAVAVLPFQNISRNQQDDFLRIALADEITTILTYTKSLEVRPASTTVKFAEGDSDPVKAGRELHVADVVTGHYLAEDKNLVVTLEAVDVVHDRLLWQTSITVPSDDRLSLRKELAERVHHGLVPVITNTASGALETATRPKNPEAYDLYLRSTAAPHDPAPNRDAITMLERSLGLDPSYAPAWDAIGLRYYYEASYGRGGENVFNRATRAFERAVSLDPNLLLGAAHLARNRVERGDLLAGYREAQDLVARRPNSAQAHFTLSYVLRYAGLLQDAAKECELAIKFDPGDYSLRSCALTFAELGREQRALDFLNLDAGSEWSGNVLPWILLRKGDLAEAREAAGKMKNDEIWFGGLLQACVAPGAAVDMETLDAAVQRTMPALLAQRDPEFQYLQGSIVAFCGNRPMAARLLQKAISKGYCSVEALSADPLLQKLRGYPEMDQLSAASQNCLKRFLAVRSQHVQ
jgi:TolB-like protein